MSAYVCIRKILDFYIKASLSIILYPFLSVYISSRHIFKSIFHPISVENSTFLKNFDLV